MLLDIGVETLHSFDVPIAFTFQQPRRHNNLRQGAAPLMPLIRSSSETNLVLFVWLLVVVVLCFLPKHRSTLPFRPSPVLRSAFLTAVALLAKEVDEGGSALHSSLSVLK